MISTGGGVILNGEAMTYLRANGLLVWVKRDIDRMILENNRPLYASKEDLYRVYQERKERYAYYADVELDNNRSIEEAIVSLKEKLK